MGEEVAQRRHRWSVGAGACIANIESDELAAAVGVDGADRAIADRGMGRQRGLDLAGLDAKAPQLDLEIAPADVVDLAVGTQRHQVSRTEQPVMLRVCRRREGIGDELLGRQIRFVVIAAGESRPGDTKLTRFADGDRPQLFVEHVNTHAAECLADGDDLALEGLRADHAARGIGRHLRGAIEVEHGGVRRELTDAPAEAAGQEFAG